MGNDHGRDKRLKNSEYQRDEKGWVLGSQVDKCMQCGVDFTVANRRHHCRFCGECLCQNCSPSRSFKPIGSMRCCRICWEFYGKARESTMIKRNSTEQNSDVPLHESGNKPLNAPPRFNEEQYYQPQQKKDSLLSGFLNRNYTTYIEQMIQEFNLPSDELWLRSVQLAKSAKNYLEQIIFYMMALQAADRGNLVVADWLTPYSTIGNILHQSGAQKDAQKWMEINYEKILPRMHISDSGKWKTEEVEMLADAIRDWAQKYVDDDWHKSFCLQYRRISILLRYPEIFKESDDFRLDLDRVKVGQEKAERAIQLFTESCTPLPPGLKNVVLMDPEAIVNLPVNQKYDLFMPNYAQLEWKLNYVKNTFGVRLCEDLHGKNRAWHEDNQQAISSIFKDSTLRDQTLNALSHEFSKTAAKIAKDLIEELPLPYEEKTIHPIFVDGAKGTQKFLVDNICFKFFQNGKGNYTCEEDALKAANREHLAYITLRELGIGGLFCPLTTIVSYRGHRVLALSLVPLGPDSLVYKSGGKVVSDERVTELVRTTGTFLNLKPHFVQGQMVYGCAELEVHQGLDGRIYFENIEKIFPPTPPEDEQDYMSKFMRPELVVSASVSLNSDAFSPIATESAELDNSEVETVFEHMKSHVIPKVAGNLNPPDIVKNLHQNGINLRYLHLVFQKIPRTHQESKTSVALEMVARAVKDFLYRAWRNVRGIAEPGYHHVALSLLNSLRDPQFWSSDIIPGLQTKFHVDAPSISAIQTIATAHPLALEQRVAELCGIVVDLSSPERPLHVDALVAFVPVYSCEHTLPGLKKTFQQTPLDFLQKTLQYQENYDSRNLYNCYTLVQMGQITWSMGRFAEGTKYFKATMEILKGSGVEVPVMWVRNFVVGVLALAERNGTNEGGLEKQGKDLLKSTEKFLQEQIKALKKNEKEFGGKNLETFGNWLSFVQDAYAKIDALT